MKLSSDKSLLILIAGLLKRRDYARKVILQGKFSKNTPVKEIMISNVLFVHPYQTIEECMAFMMDKHFRHRPVYEGKSLTGLISIGDVVKAIISGQKIEIKQLEHYISGILYGHW